MSKLPALLTILGVAIALTGCSTAEESEPTSSPDASVSALAECTAPGALSDAVTVAGDIGAEPEVTFDSPLAAEKTERTVVVAGDGTNVAGAGSVVKVSYTFYNGTTGESIDTTGYGADDAEAALIIDESQYFTGLLKAVNCAVAGDRIVTVVPPVDAFGDAGSADFNIGADDTMVFVMDINAVSASKATGVAQAPEAGFPTVTLAEDGTPSVVIPDTDAPAELMIATLKKGDGVVVADGDTVAVEYYGVLWATGETFDESWTTAGPITFATTDVVTGFGKALVGQTVGSQVIAIVPPSEGYGDAGQGAIGGTDTMVFVVDILDTAATPAG